MAINLNNILQPFGNIGIGSFYLRYYSLVDAMVYLILFIGLAQFVFMKVFKNDAHAENPFKEAKLVSVAVGLALTVGMVVMENRSGFNLGSALSPVAAIVILLVLALLLYNLFKALFPAEDEKKVSGVSASLTFLIIYALVMVPFSALNTWMNTNAPLLSSILAIASVVSFVYLLIALFGAFQKGAPAVTTTPITTATTPTTTTTTPTTTATTPAITPNTHIADLVTGIQEIRQLAHNYATIGREIIEIHRGMTNPPRALTVQDWNTFYRCEQAVINRINQFNTDTTTVLDPQQYATLNAQDMQTLTDVMYQLTLINHELLRFRNGMAQAYNQHGAPIPGNPF